MRNLHTLHRINKVKHYLTIRSSGQAGTKNNLKISLMVKFQVVSYQDLQKHSFNNCLSIFILRITDWLFGCLWAIVVKTSETWTVKHISTTCWCHDKVTPLSIMSHIRSLDMTRHICKYRMDGYGRIQLEGNMTPVSDEISCNLSEIKIRDKNSAQPVGQYSQLSILWNNIYGLWVKLWTNCNPISLTFL